MSLHEIELPTQFMCTCIVNSFIFILENTQSIKVSTLKSTKKSVLRFTAERFHSDNNRADLTPIILSDSVHAAESHVSSNFKFSVRTF